jgi:phenylalanyl-tRNA synthetase alpha chain
MNELSGKLSAIEAEAFTSLPSVKSAEDLKVFKAKYLGRNGLLTDLLKMLGSLPAEDKPNAGKQINQLKDRLLLKIDATESQLRSLSLDTALKTKVDITLPGRIFAEPGRLHPITQIMQKVQEIFMGLGFSIYEGSEIETDYYNFQALNMPPDHPARDMQDTFYVNAKHEARSMKHEEYLLRTHTSPVQIHVMKKFKPPLRMIVPGAVYRRDADVTHSPMFHQVEGLMVGDEITMGDLKGVLTEFLHQMFDAKTNVRFRPSFFPFTEPSAEVDIQCVICGGKKTLVDGNPCRVCKQTGWMEILGSGMVNPKVFENVGLDPLKTKGFAFGLGIERIAMLKFGISDIRLFFENDLRFLGQF